MTTQLLGRVWMILTALALSLAWLLPNHYPPWTSFHADAWATLVLALLAVAVAVRGRKTSALRAMDLYLLGVAVLPLVQWTLGLVTSFGIAWICSAYLLGLAFAVQAGRKWEMDSPGQCVDFLFLSIIVAATLSTALQLYQLFGPEELGAWVMSAPGKQRLFANVGQPNQLASLQLLALLGCSWFFSRGRIKASPAIALAAFLLLGVALTGSRTAWVNVAILLICSVALRKRLASPHFVRVSLWLAIYFAALVMLMPTFYELLSAYMDIQPPEMVRLAQDVRLSIWKQFLDASTFRPMWGFGWGQTAKANFLAVENTSNNYGIYNSTHNIFLDLMVWNGYPIALVLIALGAIWLVRRLQHPVALEALHLFAFIGVLSVHSMLELPLHYAIFLLPFGMVLGVLDVPAHTKWARFRDHAFAILFLVAGMVIALVTMRDYLQIERSYMGLRFEVRKLQTDIPSTPPDTWVLSQFQDYFKIARIVPHPNMGGQEIQWMRNSIGTVPSPQNIYNLAAALALNGLPDEAQRWQRSLCLTMADVSCEQAKQLWAKERYAERTGVEWSQLMKTEK